MYALSQRGMSHVVLERESGVGHPWSQQRWDSFTLVTPNNKSLTMEFDRVDEDTIAVIITNGDNELRFNVNSLGGVSGDDA